MSNCSIEKLFRDWDSSSKESRLTLLDDFVLRFQGKTEPELAAEFGHLECLFLIRVCIFVKLNLGDPAQLTPALRALHLFVTATSEKNYVEQIVENGLILTLQGICASDDSGPENHLLALQIMQKIADTAFVYREMVCDCNGIRVIAECLARTVDERVLVAARRLLECLAMTSTSHRDQVYCSFIGALPCPQARTQQQALQALLALQETRSEVHPVLIEMAFKTLESRHLEVQCAAVQLFCLLTTFDACANTVLAGLVSLLRPSREINLHIPSIEAAQDNDKKPGTTDSLMASQLGAPATPTTQKASRGTTRSRMVISPGEPVTVDPKGGLFGIPIRSLTTKPLDQNQIRKNFIEAKQKADSQQDQTVQSSADFNQQASACLCILTLCQERPQSALRLIKLGVISNLLYALGNTQHDESQRIAAQALKYFCERFATVAKVMQETLGSDLFCQLMTETEHFYFRMTPYEADLMLSNKIDYDGDDISVSVAAIEN